MAYPLEDPGLTEQEAYQDWCDRCGFDPEDPQTELAWDRYLADEDR